MKLLLPILATIAVWTAPGIGQLNPSPPTSGSSPGNSPKPSLPVNPPNTGDSSVSTKVKPQQTNSPIPSPGVGIFNAASNNPWGVPPPNQPAMQQPYQPWGVQPQLTPNWGPQPPPSQRMPWLMDIATMMDFLDIPCGISHRRRSLMVGAVDHSEPFCECRVGGCDGAMPDLSGNVNCPSVTSCCCTGNPYNSWSSASVMQSNLNSARNFGMMPGGMPGVPGGVPRAGAGYMPGRMPAGAMPNRMPGNMQGAMPAGRQGPFVPRRTAASSTYTDFTNMWYRR